MVCIFDINCIFYKTGAHSGLLAGTNIVFAVDGSELTGKTQLNIIKSIIKSLVSSLRMEQIEKFLVYFVSICFYLIETINSNFSIILSRFQNKQQRLKLFK